MEIAGKIVCIVITNSFLFKAPKLCYEAGWQGFFYPPPLIKKFVHKFAYNSQFFCQVLLNLLPGRVWMAGSPPLSVYNLHSFNVSDEAVNWNQALPFPSHSLNNKWWVEGKLRTFFLPSHFLERFILFSKRFPPLNYLSFSKYLN